MPNSVYSDWYSCNITALLLKNRCHWLHCSSTRESLNCNNVSPALLWRDAATCFIHKLLFDRYVRRRAVIFIPCTHFTRLRSGGEQLPDPFSRNTSSRCVFRSSYNISALINIPGARASSSFCACCGWSLKSRLRVETANPHQGSILMHQSQIAVCQNESFVIAQAMPE